jgi:hypothetical protein
MNVSHGRKKEMNRIRVGCRENERTSLLEKMKEDSRGDEKNDE